MATTPRVLQVACRGATLLSRFRHTFVRPVSYAALCQHPNLHTQQSTSLRCPLNSIPSRWFSSSPMTESELSNRVVNVVKMFDKVTPDKVTVEAHFVKDLGLDSLDAVEIVMAFEDEFGIEISDEEAEKILSCQDAVNLLKVKMDITE